MLRTVSLGAALELQAASHPTRKVNMHSQPLRAWSLSNVSIRCDTHWWGFVLHLNEDATQLLERIDDFEGKLVDALGSEIKPIASLIKYYLKLRNVVIKAEDQGQ